MATDHRKPSHPFLSAHMRAIGTASTLAMCIALAQPAYAQDTQEDEEGTDAPVTEEDDTIVITGYLQSLETAAEIKREADTFVDVITAEDIGALPDRSVAESLQRVPGVNVSRFEQAADPDRFSVEGSGIIIRGLPYVRSELNGRDIFSANGGRELSFNDVSPELLGRVEVFKNTTADMVEGGISGAVNLVTRKPLDNSGLKLAGSVEANYGDLIGEWSPGFSVLGSNTFETDAGTFGVQLAYAQSELKSRADASQITDPCYREDTLDGPCYRVAPVTSGGYDPDNPNFDETSFPPPGTLIVPKGAGVRTTDFERDRRAYSVVGQYESPLGNFLITAEYLRAETDASLSEFAALAQVNEAINFPTIVSGTTPVISGNEVVSAYLTQLTADDVNNPGVLTPGIPTELLRFQREDEAMTEDLSIDVEASITSRLRGNLEWQYINSDRTENGIILANRTFADIFYDNRGGTPEVQFLQPGGSQLNENVSDPDGVFYWFHLDNQVRNEGDLYSLRGDLEYDVEMGPIKQARFGARWAERNRITRSANFSNWSNLGSTWTTREGDWNWSTLQPGRFFGAGGGAYVSDFPDQANLYDPFGNDFQRGAVPVPVGPGFYYGGADLVTPYVNGDIEADLQAIKDFTRSPEGRPLIYSRDGLVDGTFLEGEISNVDESTLAAYGRIDFEQELGGGDVVLQGNIGLRWVETTVGSEGQLQLLSPDYIDAVIPGDRGGDGDGVAEVEDALNRCANIVPGQTGPGYCELSPARLQEFVNSLTGEIVADDADIKYENWLPSFNAKLDFGNGMLVRAAVSKGISRPDLAAYRTGGFVSDNTRTLVEEGTTETGALFSITTGNRLIRPIESWNYDLSFEYYWDDVGSISVSAFKKDFSNLLTFGPAPREFDIGSVQDLDILVFGTINQGDAGLQGVEVAYQDQFEFLPGLLSGFGTQLTYTYVDASDFGSDGDVFPNLSLPLVSEHTVNATLFYEKGPLSARAAYNWRSEYLQTPRDVIFPFSPIYGEATGQLDASVFYSITDNIKIGAQGVNLLDEVIETSYVLDFDGTRSRRSAFRNDRRFTFLARFDF